MATDDRSAPGVRLTVFKDEKATTGLPLDLGDRLTGFLVIVRQYRVAVSAAAGSTTYVRADRQR